jgi:hypothetical protein
VFAGQKIEVDNGDGNHTNDADGVGAGTSMSSNNGYGSLSGIAAPFAGYLIGVFVPAGGPSGAAPASLSFTGTGQTSFPSLAPALDQVFFIGDGLTGDGTGSTQDFAVPAGAAMLYLGISDSCDNYSGPPGCYNDNSGTFTVTITGNTISHPLVTDSHDFNGDGDSDMLWRDTSGDLALWEMNGTTILNPNASGLGNISTVWSVVGQRDFNGDGYADMLWRDTSGDLALWEMNGTTVLNGNSSGLGNVATNWSIVGTGDFNGDGKGDILWRDTAGDISIWEMNGTTILNPNSSGLGNLSTNWSVVGVGDFNGDGMSDILWRNSNNGNVSIWLMNGTTVTNFSTASVGNMPATWSVVGVGDFNGDGNSDILWEDTSGDLAIWEMSGTTILNPNSSSVGNLSTVWAVAETGDFNGDGKSDILWRDTSGDLAIWFMNGTTVASGAGLGTISTTFTIQGTNAD